MTSTEMMKKIGLGKNKSDGAGSNGKLKAQMLKHLKEGKNKILMFERKITGKKNVQKLMDQMDRSKEKLQEAKKNFEKYEKMAEQYIEKNPKKAVAMAAAAGMLAGSLWSVFKGNKPAPNKKKRALSPPRAVSKP
jgi:molecular chaperone GrpE (heat shock protein)